MSPSPRCFFPQSQGLVDQDFSHRLVPWSSVWTWASMPEAHVVWKLTRDGCWNVWIRRFNCEFSTFKYTYLNFSHGISIFTIQLYIYYEWLNMLVVFAKMFEYTVTIQYIPFSKIPFSLPYWLYYSWEAAPSNWIYATVIGSSALKQS